jgi:hypothetical protein
MVGLLGCASAQAAPSLALKLPDAAVIVAEQPRLKLDARTEASSQTVWPRVAVDRRLAPDVTGAVGFLCGREPGQNTAGSASAFGSDPHGRFLGARLSRAF